MRRSPNFSGEKRKKSFTELSQSEVTAKQSQVQIPPEIRAKTSTFLYNATLISGTIPKQRFMFHDIVNFA